MFCCGDILNPQKTIIPFVASVRNEVNRMLTNVYDENYNANDMYTGIGLAQLSLSSVLTSNIFLLNKLQ